ncbi:ABC transporter ATP-binding protein [Bacillus thuringiensis]|nr:MULTISPECIES: ABC transporter ATP-binding protein [Bacillus]EJV74918.1 hypothetical protein IGE_05456 [Bacillus cereus HuB1-1]PEW81015.1 ABC transporter ATP-binding protein [Bacillus thuringiensis]PGS64237.1 ABC transporter ATP-binding protein [Bacillus thuringiensis]
MKKKGDFEHLFKIYFWVLSFLKPHYRKLAFIISMGLFFTVSELAIPKFIQYIIDNILPQKNLDHLKLTLIFVIALIFLIIAIKAIHNLWQRKLIEKTSRDIQSAAFGHLYNLGFPFFEKKSVGEVLSFMNTQTQAVQSIYKFYLPLIIEDSIFTLVSLFFMIQLSSHLALIIIPCFFFYYLLGPWFEKRASIYGRNSGDALRNLNKKIYESLIAMPEIRTFSKEKWDIKRFLNLRQDYQVNFLKSIFYANLRGSFRRISYYIGAIGVFLYGPILIKDGLLSSGEFIAFILYYFTGMHVLTSLVTAVTEQKLLMYQIEPLYKFMHEQPKILEPNFPITLTGIKGEITFSNVHFSYPNCEEILNNFNLHINPGEKIALVGKSGCGKSTLIKLLGRFYDPQKGSIELDGIPLQNLSFHQLRESIGFVFQETYLFNTSIKENIRFGNPNATDKEIYEAAKQANCHNFIIKLSDGYNSHIGERGFKLSTGQKQRIAIARMLIKKAPIMVLDEATSALDNISEQKVKMALDRLLVGKTVMTIAHRLSTIKNYDKIVFIEDGKIIEIGTYQELIDKRNKFYNFVNHHISVKEVII